MARAIEELAEDPVSGSHLLRSTDYGTDILVKRVGDFRIFFSINQDTNTIIVSSVAKDGHGSKS